MGTPEQVYSRPANRFVASALGATNIVQGDVLAASGGEARVRLFGGLEVAVDVARFNGSFADRRQASLSIRPADLQLSPLGDGGVRATVSEAMFFGDVVQYALDVPGCPTPLSATGPGWRHHRPGDVVSLDVFPDRVSALDEDPSAAPSPAVPATTKEAS